MTSVASSGGQIEQLSGPSPQKGALDTIDGHVDMSRAPEELDKQCEKMKVRILFCSLLYEGYLFRSCKVTITPLPFSSVNLLSLKCISSLML